MPMPPPSIVRKANSAIESISQAQEIYGIESALLEHAVNMLREIRGIAEHDALGREHEQYCAGPEMHYGPKFGELE